MVSACKDRRLEDYGSFDCSIGNNFILLKIKKVVQEEDECAAGDLDCDGGGTGDTDPVIVIVDPDEQDGEDDTVPVDTANLLPYFPNFDPFFLREVMIGEVFSVQLPEPRDDDDDQVTVVSLVGANQ